MLRQKGIENLSFIIRQYTLGTPPQNAHTRLLYTPYETSNGTLVHFLTHGVLCIGGAGTSVTACARALLPRQEGVENPFFIIRNDTLGTLPQSAHTRTLYKLSEIYTGTLEQFLTHGVCYVYSCTHFCL